MELYPYHVIELVPNRRYPTYQLHAFTLNDKLCPETVMHICILETLSWLRGRLSKYADFPPEINLPEAYDYESFDPSLLKSFKINIGCIVDVVYSEKDMLWSFCIDEADMGVNIGQDDERKPISGRRFETNIAFRVSKEKSAVEVGVQIMCSEPADTNYDCEVFRPAVVKAMYLNPNIGLKHILNINDTAIQIESSKDLQRIKNTIFDKTRELPIVMITEPEHIKIANTPNTIPVSIESLKSDTNSYKDSILSSLPAKNHFNANITLDNKALGFDDNKLLCYTTAKSSPKASAVKISEQSKITAISPAKNAEYIKQETVNPNKLAGSLASFAFICSIADKIFDSVKASICTELKKGDILIIYKNNVNEIIPYSDISIDIYSTEKNLKSNLKLYSKRNTINFGDVIFNADARIFEIQNRRMESLSNADEIKLLKDEIEELNRKLISVDEMNRDIKCENDENRILQKKIFSYEKEIDLWHKNTIELNVKINNLSDNLNSVFMAHDFYKEKSKIAATYPDEKERVANWIDKLFSDTIFLHKNAVASLKKYVRPLDVSMLCDGIYYIHGYALFRQGKITAETLHLYAEENNWDVQNSGKAAINNYHDEYSVKIIQNNKEVSCDLNLHIKNGVNPKQWIRIYFFFDDISQKIVIGYMPDHLPTISDRT